MPELTDLEKRMREKYIRIGDTPLRESGESCLSAIWIYLCVGGGRFPAVISTPDLASLDALPLARALAKIVEEETAGIQQQSQEMRTAAEEYEKLYSETLTRLGRSEQLRQKDAETVEAAKELAEKIGVAKVSYRRPHITTKMQDLAAKIGENG